MTVILLNIIKAGERRCITCGKVHDCYERLNTGKPPYITWKDPEDGHPYMPEPWEQIARRLGFERGK